MQYAKWGSHSNGTQKGMKTVAIVLLLAFLVTMIMPVSAFAAFPDVPSNHWAIQQLDRVAARGIMGGYEDGTARPNNSVTQFEAIAMASRMMGLEYDEATQKGTYLPFKYPDWAGAYNTCVAAYAEGLIDAKDFTHNAPASREWVTKLLILAMDAEDQLNSTSNDTLSFLDASGISSAYQNYVKLAYDKGLIGGYTDGTFKPKNTVTRAELAAFLCRVENQLDTTAENVVRGDVSAISGVKVTVAGDDGKTYNLYATTTSTLYDENGKKIGVTDLTVGDNVYIVYKNNLLNYLEVQSEAVVAGSETALYGDIRAIIDVKDTIIVMDSDEELHTVIVDDKTKITEKNNKDLLAFEDLHALMKVNLKVNSKDQTASQIVIEENANGQRSGTIYSVDAYEKLITMQERSGLQTYEMAEDMEVSISGMLTATASSLKEGDKAVFTIEDGAMTAIAVGSSSDNYGGNAQVKTVDTANRILIYTTASGELKAAYYTSGLNVTFKNGETGTIADLQQGDDIEITVSGNQVSKLTVVDRNVTEGMKVTLVEIGDDLISVTDAENNLKSYFLADSVKVTLSGSTATLGSLEKGMEVELTLQNEKVTRIKGNNQKKGIVKSVDVYDDEIRISTGDESYTYDVSEDVDVKRYRKTTSRLSAVSVGDTVSLELKSNEVVVINIFEQIDMTVYDKTNSSGWIRLIDDDDNYASGDIDDIELYVDGAYSSKVSDLNIGDDVVATFEGNTLVKIEALSHINGEVKDVDISDDEITVRTFGGDTRTISFDDDSYIMKNGSKTTSLSRLSEGDRVLIEPIAGGKKITVLNSKKGEIQFATVSTGIQFLDDDFGDMYPVIGNYYCHKYNSTSEKDLSDLSRGTEVTIYYTDKDEVYEIVVH